MDTEKTIPELPSEHVEMSDDSVDHVTAKAIGGNIDDLPKGYYWSMKFVGSVIGIIFMTQSLYCAYVLPTNALSIINAELGPSPYYVLISTVTTVTSGCLLALVGRLGDILGRRYFLLGGQLFGLLGGVICVTAKNINTMIGGAVFLGIAASVQLTFTFVVCELVANRHRAYIDAILFASTIPLAGVGPAMARLIISNTVLGWRWFYYLDIITCGLSIIFLGIFYFPPNFSALHSRYSKWDAVKEIDWLGSVLFAAGVVMFMLGLSFGGSTYPWKDGHVVGLLVAGLMSLVLFGLHEAFSPWNTQPLIPGRLLRNRNYVALCCCGCVGTMIYFSLNILWPQQITALGYGTSNVQIGWLSCTTGAAVVFGQTLAGLLFEKLGHGKWQLVACCIGMCIFMGGLAAANPGNRSLALAFTSLGGLSVGFLELVHIIMVGLVCEPGDLGLASGFLASLRQVFGTLAATIYVVILENRIAHNIPADVVPAATGAGLPVSSITGLFAAMTNGTAAALGAVPGINARIEAAVAAATTLAYQDSFKTVYLVSITFGGLSVIAALCTSNVEQFMTGHVARKLKGTAEDMVDEEKIAHSDVHL